MTTTPDRIEQIRQRASAATGGPWWAWDRTHGVGFEIAVGPAYDGAPARLLPEGQRTDIGRLEDAEFIAHCRQDVPWLLDRLAAVLTLHQPRDGVLCGHCDEVYPCPTVRAAGVGDGQGGGQDGVANPGRQVGVESAASCIFCRADDPDVNTVLARVGSCYLRADNYPAASGHVEVVPYRHVVSLFDLTGQEWSDVHELLNVARTATPADGYTIGVNEGTAAGRTVDHVHVHLIPRRHGDVPDPRGGIRQVLPGVSPDLWAPAAEGVAR